MNATSDLRLIRTARKETREILRDLDKRGGWTARQTKCGHIRLLHKNGGTVMLPSTPRGGRRSHENTLADIRRVEKGMTA